MTIPLPPALPPHFNIGGYKITALVESGPDYHLYQALSPEGHAVLIREFCPGGLVTRDLASGELAVFPENESQFAQAREAFETQYAANAESKLRGFGTVLFLYPLSPAQPQPAVAHAQALHPAKKPQQPQLRKPVVGAAIPGTPRVQIVVGDGLSSAAITSAGRVELPVEGGFMKLLDLDRCYSVSRIPVEGSKELVLYNLHLSAYTSDGTIATEQLKLLLADMQSEYDAGNWCVAGGDFNKDLLGDSAAWFGEADQEYSWAQPIPAGTFEGLDISLVTPLDKDDPVPSCRNADGPYHQGQYVLTVDGFLVTANVTAESAVVIDTGFAWSDHNPVAMTFMLRP